MASITDLCSLKPLIFTFQASLTWKKDLLLYAVLNRGNAGISFTFLYTFTVYSICVFWGFLFPLKRLLLGYTMFWKSRANDISNQHQNSNNRLRILVNTVPLKWLIELYATLLYYDKSNFYKILLLHQLFQKTIKFSQI